MRVRSAYKSELNRINELRKQLFDLHASEQPEVFKPGSSQEVLDAVHDIWDDPEQDLIVAEQDGTICGYAVLHHLTRPKHPVLVEQDFLNIDEIIHAVDKG